MPPGTYDLLADARSAVVEGQRLRELTARVPANDDWWPASEYYLTLPIGAGSGAAAGLTPGTGQPAGRTRGRPGRLANPQFSCASPSHQDVSSRAS